MRGVAEDMRHAFRAIAGKPGVSLAIAVTLALGLGINGTVLGMADALLLRPFPFRDHDRLVVLWETVRGSTQRELVAPGTYLDWRSELAGAGSLAAWEWWDATLSGGDQPVRVQAFRVSSTFFEVLGVEPAAGRSFTADEERPGGDRRVVIGDGLWRRAFGADPAVVGKQLLLDGEPHTVVGIAPRRFAFPVGSELWAPLALAPERTVDRENRTLTVAGRLARGRSRAQLQAELDVIADRLAREHPRTHRDRGALAQSLSVAFRDDIAVPFVGLLHAAAGLVLLATCASIAGLLLARAIDRRRELALRAALGASRAGIVRQILSETVVLGLFSSVGALAFTWAGLELLRTSVSPETARHVEGWSALQLDLRLGLAIPALAIAVAAAVGLAPALSAARIPPMEALKEGSPGAVGRRRRGGRHALVTAEIAFSLALLVVAGLTAQGGLRLASRSGGFEPEGLLRLEVVLPDRTYEPAAARRELAEALLARLEAHASVRSVALANVLPASGWNPTRSFQVERHEVAEPSLRPRAGYRSVSAGFFEALRVPVLRGRVFSGFDHEEAEAVAVVSASLAERFWPGQDPIGRRLRLEDPQSEWLSVVGVVGDVEMYNWWDGADPGAIYRPLRQAPPAGALRVALRPAGDAASALAAARGAVKALDPLLPVEGVSTMRKAIADSSSGLTSLGGAMAACGAVALLLSVVGITGVMSYAIRQRTREFGVRLALGATRGAVLRAAMASAATITGAGVALGLVLAALLGRALASGLAGAVELDPLTFGAATLTLGVVALAAAYLPARRVLRLDPARILRTE
jgi:putative ABC transport system permease protein